MRLVALTGLSRESLGELAKRHIRTFEFHSANNVLAFQNISVGDTIFLSEVSPADLTPGLCGSIAVVKGFDTRMQHVYYSTSVQHEEMDTMSARAQMGYVSIGKIKSVEQAGLYEPVFVDVIDVKYCEAR